VTFSPLLQQISIGVGAFLVGLLIGVLGNRQRVRTIRKDGQALAERLEAELALERLRITDLKMRVASYQPSKGAWAAELDAPPPAIPQVRDDVGPIAQSPSPRTKRAYSLREQTSDPARSQR